MLQTSKITCFWQNKSSSDTALQCEMFRFFDTGFEASVSNVTSLVSSSCLVSSIHVALFPACLPWINPCLAARTVCSSSGLEVFTGPKIRTRTRRDPKICCTEPTWTRILFESGTRTRADPRNALNVLPGPDADPTIIRKLDPNPAGKTQTRLHPKKNSA